MNQTYSRFRHSNSTPFMLINKNTDLKSMFNHLAPQIMVVVHMSVLIVVMEITSAFVPVVSH